MPETFGKRARRDAKAQKARARDERRVERNKRKDARAAGLLERGPELGEPFDPNRPTDMLPPRPPKRAPSPDEVPSGGPPSS